MSDSQKETELIIGAAIEVHRHLGPGLMESAYEECLCRELSLRGISFQCQLAVPVFYKGVKLDCGYRIDLLVANSVVLELKAVEKIEAIYQAQLLTYLRLTGKHVGLLECVSKMASSERRPRYFSRARIWRGRGRSRRICISAPSYF